jgi:hypothetical protein
VRSCCSASSSRRPSICSFNCVSRRPHALGPREEDVTIAVHGQRRVFSRSIGACGARMSET